MTFLCPQVWDPVTKQSTDEKVNIGQVYEEFNSSVSHDFRCRKETKLNAFTVPGVDVPETCEYLKVKISFLVLNISY